MTCICPDLWMDWLLLSHAALQPALEASSLLSAESQNITKEGVVRQVGVAAVLLCTWSAGRMATHTEHTPSLL